ncbi:MAG TPA: tryptophan synthase subunit alpha [Polyangia bacterium]|nr:tryptophan synthase subunit alpha [Polyangia bacterium]
MTRLEQIFARCRSEKRKALVVYLTASDPDFDTSRRLMLAAAAAGADIIEVGVPWSDPSADGIAIQAAMQRALAAGGGLTPALALCRAVRAENKEVGLVLFGYANPIVITGPEAFAKRAHESGADALLCVDWPPDEGVELLTALTKHEVGYIPLLAPTSTPARAAVAASAARGFMYYVSMTGTTGVKLSDLEGPRKHVQEIRDASGDRHPIVVGFGITTPEDARAVAAFADGVVVGSAAVRIVEQAATAKRDPAPELGAFVKKLADALR